MAHTPRQRLKKELGLFDVYAIATGATLSSGFFLLPGLAAVGAGPALPLSYLLAAVVLVPGVMSKAELATAMPRAGGEYYFLDRSMGPLMGTIGGFGTWCALTLKSAFALIGIGAYLRIFLPEFAMMPLVASFAITLGLVNIVGTKRTGSLQVFLVMSLLLLLIWFTGVGFFKIDPRNFTGVLQQPAMSIVSTAGLVIVSYMGLTNVASVAEEVRNPERNLPLGIFLAFATAVLVYVAGTSVMVGVLSAETLARGGGDLRPVATAAEVLVGQRGAILMTAAAVLAFASVANAGILSASRYPLAMSRDNLLPGIFSHVGRRGTPTNAIVATVILILVFVLLFDPTKIAKLASAFLLVMFALNCLAVLVMRESGIPSYDPGYRSPFYPWLHMLGVLGPFWLIVEMGFLPTAFTGGLFVFGAIWYTYYARDRVSREGAIFHVFERLGRQRDAGLEIELRDIMKEKGLRHADPFEEIVAHAAVIEAPKGTGFRQLIWEVAAHFSESMDVPARVIAERFLEGTIVGMTSASHRVALPHVRLPGIAGSGMVLVRCPEGIVLDVRVTGREARMGETIRAVFFLVSPERDPGQHLRILAEIASRVDQEDFIKIWLTAEDHQVLKEMLLRDERVLALTLGAQYGTEALIGLPLRELAMPDGTLIALIRRGEEVVIPRGRTVLEEDDRLTIIGEPQGLRAIRGQHVRLR